MSDLVGNLKDWFSCEEAKIQSRLSTETTQNKVFVLQMVFIQRMDISLSFTEASSLEFYRG